METEGWVAVEWDWVNSELERMRDFLLALFLPSLSPKRTHALLLVFPARSTKSFDSWLLAAHIRGSRAGAQLRQRGGSRESSHQSPHLNNTSFHVSGPGPVVRNDLRCTHQTSNCKASFKNQDTKLPIPRYPGSQDYKHNLTHTSVWANWLLKYIHFACHQKSTLITVWARWLTCSLMAVCKCLQLHGPL